MHTGSASKGQSWSHSTEKIEDRDEGGGHMTVNMPLLDDIECIYFDLCLTPSCEIDCGIWSCEIW